MCLHGKFIENKMSECQEIPSYLWDFNNKFKAFFPPQVGMIAF